MSDGIDHLIINSPFSKPAQHWAYKREAILARHSRA